MLVDSPCCDNSTCVLVLREVGYNQVIKVVAYSPCSGSATSVLFFLFFFVCVCVVVVY